MSRKKNFMYKEKINTLIIGLGKIGCGYDFSEDFEEDKPFSSKRIITHARATSVHPNFNLIAGIDNEISASKRFSFLYKKPSFDCIENFKNNTNYKIDLVIIAVIPQNQPKLVEEVISELNPKIILLEKPLATSLEETNRIKNLCASQPNLIVFVNYVRRYLPLVKNWRDIIVSGKIGSFLSGNIIYGKGLLTNGSHFINLAQYWLGQLKHQMTLKNDLKYQEFDKEASFILKTKKNEALLNIISIGGHSLRAGELDLWFEKGRLCWLNNGNSLYFWPRLSSKSLLETYDSLSADPEVHFTEITKCQYYVLESISRYFFGDKTCSIPCSIDDSLQTMKLMNDALLSDVKNGSK